MKLVVDTGVFSASLQRRPPRPHFESAVTKLKGNKLFLAPQTVAELRYDALVAGWGDRRRARLEHSIASATVVPPMTVESSARWGGVSLEPGHLGL